MPWLLAVAGLVSLAAGLFFGALSFARGRSPL
jgi:hypothetical protein